MHTSLQENVEFWLFSYCLSKSSTLAHVFHSQQLLAIVQQKAMVGVMDSTLKFALSALWNLTDEMPIAARNFIDCQGLELYEEVLEVEESKNDTDVQINRCMCDLFVYAVLFCVAVLLHWAFNPAESSWPPGGCGCICGVIKCCKHVVMFLCAVFATVLHVVVFIVCLQYNIYFNFITKWCLPR